jgi:hypothetical protein
MGTISHIIIGPTLTEYCQLARSPFAPTETTEVRPQLAQVPSIGRQRNLTRMAIAVT